ncbi:hypothetical protein ACP4OV_008341 [Aristida adscensionis]
MQSHPAVWKWRRSLAQEKSLNEPKEEAVKPTRKEERKQI